MNYAILIPLLSTGIFAIVLMLSAFHVRKPGNVQLPMKHIRKIVYSLALIIGTALFYYAMQSSQASAISLASLMRYYGLAALLFLFLSLVPGLMLVYFPGFFINPLLVQSRRAIGVSAFGFAALHGLIALFNNFSGSLDAILLLQQRHQIAVILGTAALTIFLLMALTSFDRAVQWLTFKRWKFLHRFTYVGIVLVLFHAFLIGSHFTESSSFIPLLVNCAALTFILLESGATAKMLIKQQRPRWKNIAYGVMLTTIVTIGFFLSITTLKLM